MNEVEKHLRLLALFISLVYILCAGIFISEAMYLFSVVMILGGILSVAMFLSYTAEDPILMKGGSKIVEIIDFILMLIPNKYSDIGRKDKNSFTVVALLLFLVLIVLIGVWWVSG